MIKQATLYRFSKMIKIPPNQLDHVLVSKIIGVDKNLPEVYKALKRDQIIRNAAKLSGKSFQDVLNWLEQP